MKRYTILLVDDEAEIREGIIKKIDWEKYGFQIIGSAETGRDALEIAESMRPDVVMTDVMMPFMNGLELGEKLIRMIPDIKLIIFSGVDDFEYAQRALKMQAVEYVLKPIDAAEMGGTLIRLKENLDREYEKKRDLETLRQHYIESIPIIREQFLVGLVEGRADQEQLQRNSGLGQLDLDAWGYTVGLFRLEPKELEAIKGELFSDHDIALVPTTLRQMTDETLHLYAKVSSFYYGDTVGIVANLYKKGDIFKLAEGMDLICKNMKKIYGLTVTGGIGTICHDPLELRYTRKEAQTALSYRISLGSGQAIYLGDVEPENNASLQFQGSDERDLIAAIKLGNEKEIRGEIHKIFCRLQEHMLMTEQLSVYFTEVKVGFLRLLQYYNIRQEELFGKGDMLPILDGMQSLEDGMEWMLDISLKMSQLITKSRVSSRSAITTRAKDYVNEHYANEEMSVEMVSQILHVSPSYFSSLFKKEVGVSFITYLTDIRMEKALELLENTDDKSYMIAEKVGYSEPNYFSYVFKKHYGLSPQRYRKRK